MPDKKIFLPQDIPYKDLNHPPSICSILGVPYAHFSWTNGSELFLTEYGLFRINELHPDNFVSDKNWFSANSERLCGTSCIYRVALKSPSGKNGYVILKWNRMGQDIPGVHDTEDTDVEFNSPFEEFAMVTELRSMLPDKHFLPLQKPLAVYVSPEHVDLWQSGRRDYKMAMLIKTHSEITIHMHRLYAVVYEWIKGMDASEAVNRRLLRQQEMTELTLQARDELLRRGFYVFDSKPQHIIVRAGQNNSLLKKRNGQPLYALIDYELLRHTGDYQEKLLRQKRTRYLKKQKDRFQHSSEKFPPHLHLTEYFNVQYVYGAAETTRGSLWVVGKDPELFDYFLPERWEFSPRIRLSIESEIYYTISKDSIHLVWKVSRAGARPNYDPFNEQEKKILDYGYNSPFEEISMALYLSSRGIPTIYPRAVYMTGHKVDVAAHIFDKSRYDTHRSFLTSDGFPILRTDRDYILIWGYWNGPDEKLAARDGDYYEGINVRRAYTEGIISKDEYIRILSLTREKLLQVGVEDLNLRGSHLLISRDQNGNIVCGPDGEPEVRISNFELLKKNL